MSLVDTINGAMEITIPAAHKLGIKAVEARRGFAAATVPLEGNGNHFGVVYAGVEFTVAEILGGDHRDREHSMPPSTTRW